MEQRLLCRRLPLPPPRRFADEPWDEELLDQLQEFATSGVRPLFATNGGCLVGVGLARLQHGAWAVVLQGAGVKLVVGGLVSGALWQAVRHLHSTGSGSPRTSSWTTTLWSQGSSVELLTAHGKARNRAFGKSFPTMAARLVCTLGAVAWEAKRMDCPCGLQHGDRQGPQCCGGCPVHHGALLFSYLCEYRGTRHGVSKRPLVSGADVCLRTKHRPAADTMISSSRRSASSLVTGDFTLHV